MNMLRQIRERKGLTVSQLAARASISTRVISEYEEGTHPLPLAHAKLLAKALWVGIEDLMPPASAVLAGQAQVAQAPTYKQTRGDDSQSTRLPTPQPEGSQQVLPPMSGRLDAKLPESPSPVVGNNNPQADAQSKPLRPTRLPAPPPGPISEGQNQELARLAVRLNITLEQLEERIGKGSSTLTRPEATEWIKRLRGMADQVAPTTRVKVGQWPEMHEDQEASYLKEHRGREPFFFKLFNGDELTGPILDYTPYTITVQPDDGPGEMVLRKLAIVYYRCLPGTPTSIVEQESGHEHATDDHHQPLDKGIDSDHAGQPDVPEEDDMDDDRGI
ncbi:MAG: helix-turn-helix transcriptional regulator [Chloroflexota bacterium]|nr:helix-turn-helix transcriptional regulator [Chloroflexota bacterium]